MTTTTKATQVSHCRACHQRIELLGGSWTDPAGCIACYLGDPSAAYAPTSPSRAARFRTWSLTGTRSAKVT